MLISPTINAMMSSNIHGAHCDIHCFHSYHLSHDQAALTLVPKSAPTVGLITIFFKISNFLPKLVGPIGDETHLFPLPLSGLLCLQKKRYYIIVVKCDTIKLHVVRYGLNRSGGCWDMAIHVLASARDFKKNRPLDQACCCNRSKPGSLILRSCYLTKHSLNT